MRLLPEDSPTILIVNFHSSCNAGDAALLEAAVLQFCSSFHQPRIIVAANYPREVYLHSLNVKIVPSFGAFIGLSAKRPLLVQICLFIVGLTISTLVAICPRICFLERLLPHDLSDLLLAYRQADLIVGCPGNMFLTLGRFGWPFVVSAVAIFMAYLFNKPMYVMPQSIGPLRRRWERFLLGWLYSRARIVFVREHRSLHTALKLNLPPSKLHYCPDLAFGLSTATDPECAVNLLSLFGYSPGIPTIGVSVINRLTQSLAEKDLVTYYATMARALTSIVLKYRARVYFFPQVTGPSESEDDRIAAKHVVEMMQNVRDNVVVLYEPLPPASLKALYGLMDAFIATRMHSGIFALSMGVPTLFIGYLTKIRGMLESLNLEEWLIEFENIEAERLLRKFDVLWSQRHTLKKILRETIPTVAEETYQVGRLIAQDYYGRK